MILVRNTGPLSGAIEIQGSKNAVLPMMAAALLAEGTTTFTNVPRIQDVFCMMGILQFIGCQCSLVGNTLTIDASVIEKAQIPEHYVTAMRSSVMMLGALLARKKEALTRYPGGCLIGSRPIDLHIKALTCLGAEITEEQGWIRARTEGLVGGEIILPYPSVGATENALLASVLSLGTTRIEGAAKEPEIQELCLLLNQMGARIEGAGTSCLTINGVKRLSGVTRRVAGDRIVAGTYLAAVMAGGGKALLKGINPKHLLSVLETFSRSGAVFEAGEDEIEVVMEGCPRGFDIVTGPYPEFPTDLQSPAMAVMAMARGDSRIEETVFESRFATAGELLKLGARIEVDGRNARIFGAAGKFPLKGAVLIARDLRGGAAAVIGGMKAEGETKIMGCQYIRRGYEDICRDLKALGVPIEDRNS